MVDQQLVGRGIKDAKVIAAFRVIERHKFVPPELEEKAYEDRPLPIGEGQTISQPYIVALMSELLKLTGKEKVLEIGTGSGYQAAILAKLAKSVYTIERFALLADRAKAVFQGLNLTNIESKVADGTSGWQEEAPFNCILIAAASEDVPQALINQLENGGRLIAPLGGSFSQVLTLIEKEKSGNLKSSQICGCVFVPLVGTN